MLQWNKSPLSKSLPSLSIKDKMINFVGKPPFLNRVWVALKTMHFHIAKWTTFFICVGPNSQFTVLGMHRSVKSLLSNSLLESLSTLFTIAFMLSGRRSV